MTTQRIGLVLFWLGAAYIAVASWLVMWWLAPFWRAAAPEAIEGTAFAFGGVVFTLIALSVPVGIVLAGGGMALYSGFHREGLAPVALLLLGLLGFAASLLVAPTMAYFPNLFGILGGIIMVLFLMTLWYWARLRIERGSESPLADALQVLGYLGFYLTATTSCAMLGNPFGGLFFPETIAATEGALPYYYSMGTKIAVYLAVGWAATLASQYARFRVRLAPGAGSAEPARAGT